MIFDLFSRRRRAERGDIPDVYVYDTLPQKVRIQIIHLWRRAFWSSEDAEEFPSASGATLEKACAPCRELLREEYGVFALSRPTHSAKEEIEGFFLAENDVEKCMDVIEVLFFFIDGFIRERIAEIKTYRGFRPPNILPDDAIEVLNLRLKEGGIGYAFESGKIIQINSQFLHAETVKPALALLSAADFSGANDEFLRAHAHFRSGEYGDCLSECLKAFESVMKIVCEKRRWTLPAKATASTLIDLVLSNELVPIYFQNHFTGLRTVLESGIPTPRNKADGHGQGSTKHNVPEYLAAYVLHQTAASILFLVKAHQNR